MGRIYNAFTEWLAQDKWEFKELGDCRLEMGIAGKKANYACYLDVDEEKGRALFYSVAPLRAPEELRGGVAEFITRANYGLPLGNFEMDFSDGEIRFKTSADLQDIEPNVAIIRSLIYTNIMALDRYVPGLTSVIASGAAPGEAVSICEG